MEYWRQPRCLWCPQSQRFRNQVARLVAYRDFMNPWRAFSRHPASVGETYLEHLRNAAGFSGRMIGAGIACLLHGLFPFLFEHTASACVERLHDRMMTRRRLAVASREGQDTTANQST